MISSYELENCHFYKQLYQVIRVHLNNHFLNINLVNINSYM